MKQEDLISEMNAYYDRRTSEHDRLMNYTDNKTMEALLRPIIQLIEPHIVDRRVLEIACGTGNWTQVLAKRARAVLATDINKSVLKIAKEKRYARDVTFVQHDAYALDELGGYFDVAFASDWWSHIPKTAIPMFFRNLQRTLLPGATIIMLDMTMSKYFRDEPSSLDSDGNRLYKRRTHDSSEYQVVKNFPTESELRKAVEDTASTIEYHESDRLERWLLIYRLKS